MEGRPPPAHNEAPDQWAPALNDDNEWIRLDNTESTQCMEYKALNGGREPPWGKDGSSAALKHHILCCKHHLQSPDRGNSGFKREPPSSKSKLEKVVIVTGPMIKGAWFSSTNGWAGGSHDDAVRFCALKEFIGSPMELCPYVACECM